MSYNEKEYTDIVHKTAQAMYGGTDETKKHFNKLLLNNSYKDIIPKIIEDSIKLIEEERFSEKRITTGDWWDLDNGLKKSIELCKDNDIILSNDIIDFSEKFGEASQENKLVHNNLTNYSNSVELSKKNQNLPKLKNLNDHKNVRVSERLFSEKTSRPIKPNPIVNTPNRSANTSRITQQSAINKTGSGYKKFLNKNNEKNIVIPTTQPQRGL